VDGRRFDSSDVNETVHVGHTGNNEMCNLYLMFYADTPTALQCHDTRLSIQSGVRAPALASAHGGVRLCMHAVCISREGKLLVTLLLKERLCASGGGGGGRWWRGAGGVPSAAAADAHAGTAARAAAAEGRPARAHARLHPVAAHDAARQGRAAGDGAGGVQPPQPPIT
jgi:hypothetical protein